MSEQKPRILVVDDEPKYSHIIRINLEARGYKVYLANTGLTAIDMAAVNNPDLIILDVRMPQMDGFEACHRIRQFSSVPIIMLTALVEDVDKVKGLDLGADDYITKPFNIEELLARVRAALRRVELAEQSTNTPRFQAGDLVVDLVQQRAYVGDEEEVNLTLIEFRLLQELINRVGQVVTSKYLLTNVWGAGYEGDERVLRQAIYRLRKKIEQDPKNPKYIQTKSGMGYIFSVPD